MILNSGRRNTHLHSVPERSSDFIVIGWTEHHAQPSLLTTILPPVKRLPEKRREPTQPSWMSANHGLAAFDEYEFRLAATAFSDLAEHLLLTS